jgi:octaprenyl-diphosphate synthase
MTQSSTALASNEWVFSRALERNAESLKLVERAMREQFTSDAALVGLLGEHLLQSGGKRMRPALVMLTAQLCGYTGSRRIQVGAAIELLHTASLLHDDVVDFSELRRGRPSANSLWGNRRAILAGDFLYSRACTMIVEDGDPDILLIFANAIRSMAEGEILQLERSYDPTVTEAHYFKVIERKSAMLLSTSTESGAILGGVTRAERRSISNYGRELGLAFQLRDDALDYEAGEEALGKIPNTDIREGKVTLPLLLALKRCTSAEREEIAVLIKSASQMSDPGLDTQADPEPLDLAPVLDLIARYRGVEDTVRRAEEHAARAVASIAPFPDCDAKVDLAAAAQFAVTRDR